ncbi:MAG TPA: hypothetical protein VHA75_05325, partial [Rugosimonospora sp.]|nr:hypothetical protein [Rugosimonospora sp.]
MKQVVKAIMEHGEAGWLGSTQGLPDGKQAMAVGKGWQQTARMLRDATERTLRVPSGSVVLDIRIDDPELQKLIDEVKRTQAVLRDAKFEAAAAMGTAARTLTRKA